MLQDTLGLTIADTVCAAVLCCSGEGGGSQVQLVAHAAARWYSMLRSLSPNLSGFVPIALLCQPMKLTKRWLWMKLRSTTNKGMELRLIHDSRGVASGTSSQCALIVNMLGSWGICSTSTRKHHRRVPHRLRYRLSGGSLAASITTLKVRDCTEPYCKTLSTITIQATRDQRAIEVARAPSDLCQKRISGQFHPLWANGVVTYCAYSAPLRTLDTSILST